MNSAIHPGTFDPITFGHLDLIERALKIFDHLIVAVGQNPQKSPIFTVEERVDMIREVTREHPGVEVTHYNGLTVQFAKERQVFTVVRSLRTVSEYEIELALAMANRQQNPNLEHVYLMPSIEYTYLSSTIVREVAQFGGDLSPFVPPIIADRLRAKFPAHP